MNYIHGQRTAANALMIKDNPEMTEAELEASVALMMQQQGIVDSGEVLAKGHRRETEGRIHDFYAQMVKAGCPQGGRGRSLQGGDLPVRQPQGPRCEGETSGGGRGSRRGTGR